MSFSIFSVTILFGLFMIYGICCRIHRKYKYLKLMKNSIFFYIFSTLSYIPFYNLIYFNFIIVFLFTILYILLQPMLILFFIFKNDNTLKLINLINVETFLEYTDHDIELLNLRNEMEIELEIQENNQTTEQDDDTTEQDDDTSEQDDDTSEQDDDTNEQDDDTTEQDDDTNEQDDDTNEQDDDTNEQYYYNSEHYSNNEQDDFSREEQDSDDYSNTEEEKESYYDNETDMECNDEEKFTNKEDGYYADTESNLNFNNIKQDEEYESFPHSPLLENY